MVEIPKIVSVDDHVIEPAGVWQDRLPAKYLEIGPRLERRKVKNMKFVGGVFSYEAAGDDEDGTWCDWWLIEDLQYPLTRLSAAAGYPRDEITVSPITMDDMRKGCWDQKARLEDMDVNHVDASLAFPSFPRFCGQTFAERKDLVLGDLCVKAYNDWMFDEWCAGTNGRLIPLIIVQLWDSQARGRGDPPQRGARLSRGHVLGDPAVPRLPVDPRQGRLLGSVPPCVRGDRDGHQHAHRFVVEDAEHVGRRARRGRLHAHLHERGDVAHRLVDERRVRAFPATHDRLQRGPDRLDPLRPRARRQGVGRQPRLGRRRRQGEAPAVGVLLRAHLRLFLRRPPRPPVTRERRRGQRHLRDRLPAQRQHLAAHQEGRRRPHEGPHPGPGQQDLPQQRDQDAPPGKPNRPRIRHIERVTPSNRRRSRSLSDHQRRQFDRVGRQ